MGRYEMDISHSGCGLVAGSCRLETETSSFKISKKEISRHYVNLYKFFYHLCPFTESEYSHFLPVM
jgi:hypothetical protein